MRIAWIGGLERNEVQISAIAKSAGHVMDYHPGHTGGRGSDEIRVAVERADFVVVLTDVNSHGAVQLAKRMCQKLGRGIFVTRRCGPARFRQLLDAMTVRDERLLVAS